MNKPSAWAWLAVGAVLIWWLLGYHGTVGIDLGDATVGGKPVLPPAPAPPSGPASTIAEVAQLGLTLGTSVLEPPPSG